MKRDESETMMTPKEVAELLHVHRVTVYRLLRRGELRGAFKVGGVWRFNRQQLMDALSRPVPTK